MLEEPLHSRLKLVEVPSVLPVTHPEALLFPLLDAVAKRLSQSWLIDLKVKELSASLSPDESPLDLEVKIGLDFLIPEGDDSIPTFPVESVHSVVAKLGTVEASMEVFWQILSGIVDVASLTWPLIPGSEGPSLWLLFSYA